LGESPAPTRFGRPHAANTGLLQMSASEKVAAGSRQVVPAMGSFVATKRH